jgi:hypothetical protein
MNTYTAQVRLANGSLQEVTLQANSALKAHELLEAQYGKGNVAVWPMQKQR